MNNALLTAEAGAPLISARPTGLAASRPPQLASRRWKAFALLVVAYFITIVDFTIVNVALPTIGRELRFPESGLQWVCGLTGLAAIIVAFVLIRRTATDNVTD